MNPTQDSQIKTRSRVTETHKTSLEPVPSRGRDHGLFLSGHILAVTRLEGVVHSRSGPVGEERRSLDSRKEGGRDKRHKNSTRHSTVGSQSGRDRCPGCSGTLPVDQERLLLLRQRVGRTDFRHSSRESGRIILQEAGVRSTESLRCYFEK